MAAPCPRPRRCAYRHGLHIAGTQRTVAVEQPSLDHRCVADQLGTLPHQSVRPAQGVFPVIVGHVVEDIVQKGPRRLACGDIQVGGMGGTQFSHGTILTIRADPGDGISARGRQVTIQPRRPVGYPAAPPDGLSGRWVSQPRPMDYPEDGLSARAGRRVIPAASASGRSAGSGPTRWSSQRCSGAAVRRKPTTWSWAFAVLNHGATGQ